MGKIGFFLMKLDEDNPYNSGDSDHLFVIRL